MLKLTYLSHSAFILDDGAHQLIIDPFLTGNPNAAAKAEDVKVQFVVVTHAHGDHLGDAFQIARKNDALFIGTNELANYAASQVGGEYANKSIRAHNMHIGGSYNFPFGRLKFTIAHHGSCTNDNITMGNPSGVIIKMGGKTVYHCGDTGLFLDMKLIGELDKIDVMLVPIGDNFTMGIDDAVKAIQFVNPELAIPIHYNTFPVIQVDTNEFMEKCDKVGKKCHVMAYGEEYNF